MSDELYSLLYIVELFAGISFKCFIVVFMYLYIRRMK